MKLSRILAFIIGLQIVVSLPPIWANRESNPLTINAGVFPSELTTPKAIVSFLKKEFKFVEDRALFGKEDYWQSPDEFWKRRTGDCEDYALFAQRALTEHGIEAYVISLYGPNQYAHTIVIFKENSLYQVINEDRLYRYNTKTMEEAMTYINPYWTWGAIAQLQDGRGHSVRQLINPTPKSPDLFSEFPQSY